MKRIFPHSFDLGHHHEGFFEYILVTLYTNQTKKHMTGLYPEKPADSFISLLPDSPGLRFPSQLSPWGGSEKHLSQLLLPIVFASSFHQLVPPERPVPNSPEFERKRLVAVSVVGGLFPTVIKALWVYC